MGASSEEYIRMTYTLHTIPLTEKEFQFYFTKHSKFIKNDWTADLDDYDTYKDDPDYKKLSKARYDNGKKIEAFKDMKRKESKK